MFVLKVLRQHALAFSLWNALNSETYPYIFSNFNKRLEADHGFDRPNPARERVWNISAGKATFKTPPNLAEDPDLPKAEQDVLMLMTIRSHDQFNTPIHGYNDRLRGNRGTRRVLLINAGDAQKFACANGDEVDLTTAAGDGVLRTVKGLKIVHYDIPAGCCAGFFPECNPLLPVWHHATRSKVPAAKAIPVRISKP